MALQAPKSVRFTKDNPPFSESFLDPVVELYRRLLRISVIDALYAEWHSDGLDVWLVLNGATEADRRRIYEQESAVMQNFPGLGLDVYILDRQEIDIDKVVDLERVDIFIRFPEVTHA